MNGTTVCIECCEMMTPRTQDPMGAVVYTIVILMLFGSLIVLLMIRAIRPKEDEQVSVLLSSLRVRIEGDERRRRQTQMKEAKERAQGWLSDLASRRISFRRAHSDLDNSIRSLPLKHLKPRVTSRANSYQGYLPEIVVTGEPAHTRSPSKSISSYENSIEEDIFSNDD